jgi:ribosomal-protein-serine acetyltransferase
VNHHADIGYWLSEHYNGRGFMTAAVEKLIQIGFEEYGLNRQVIRAMSHNSASRNVAERLSFTHEGCQRQAANQYGTYYDLEVYSLLKSEWSAT